MTETYTTEEDDDEDEAQQVACANVSIKAQATFHPCRRGLRAVHDDGVVDVSPPGIPRSDARHATPEAQVRVVVRSEVDCPAHGGREIIAVALGVVDESGHPQRRAVALAATAARRDAAIQVRNRSPPQGGRGRIAVAHGPRGREHVAEALGQDRSLRVAWKCQ